MGHWLGLVERWVVHDGIVAQRVCHAYLWECPSTSEVGSFYQTLLAASDLQARKGIIRVDSVKWKLVQLKCG